MQPPDAPPAAAARQLPPPHQGEPANLRRDILDELADHLHCATQRELRRTDDPHAARRAVLERFGDPARLANQLWLDAMKEQLMNQRMTFITQLAMILAVAVLCIVVITSLRQNQRMQEALIARLETAAAASAAPTDAAELAASYNWPTFRLQLLEPDGTRGMADQSVRMQGEPYSPGDKKWLDARTDAEGRAAFGPMRPGIYTLSIWGRDGNHTRSVTVSPGPAEPIVIKWIDVPSALVPVALRLDLPEAASQAMSFARLELSSHPLASSKPGTWTWPSVYVALDSQGNVATIPKEHPLRTSYQLSPEDFAGLDWRPTIDLNPAIRYVANNNSAAVLVTIENESDGSTTTATLQYFDWTQAGISPSGSSGDEHHLIPGPQLEEQFQQRHVRPRRGPVTRPPASKPGESPSGG